MKRRFWAGLLSFVMLWSLLPVSAAAEGHEPTIEWGGLTPLDYTLSVQVFHENEGLQWEKTETEKHLWVDVHPASGTEVYKDDSEGGSYLKGTGRFTFGPTKASLKLYTRSTAGHKVTVNYVFNDASGKTKDSVTKSVKYNDTETFDLTQDHYDYTIARDSGDAAYEVTLLKKLSVTGGAEDSVITVTYTPKDHVIYIDPYYDNGGILAKWNGENIRVNGPELVDNNALAEESVVRNSDLTAKMEEYRFLTVNGATYDFSYARVTPSVRDDPITVTDIWYDREDGMWYYSYTGREGIIRKIPLVNEGGINFCYNTVHNENSKHHDFVATTTVEPTCTEKGYTVYKCAYCTKTETRDYTDPLNHDWKWVHDDTTSGADSKHYQVCQREGCNETERSQCNFTISGTAHICNDCKYTYGDYTLTYDANGGRFSGGAETKQDSTAYSEGERAALASEGELIPAHDDVEGSKVLFLGWTENADSRSKIYAHGDEVPALVTEVAMTGNKTVYAVYGLDDHEDGTPDVYQAKVTYRVENGYWITNQDDVRPDEIVVWFNLYEKQNGTWQQVTPAPTLGDTVPVGHSDKPGYTGAGWFMDDSPNKMESAPDRRTAVAKAETLYTFKYVDASHKTDIVDTLNAIVKKEFTKTNNVESGDVTFTAKATITKQEPEVDIQSLPEVEPAGASHTILGTVTLSTKVGTGSFVFARSLDDVNPADGVYLVKVSEVNGGADNVTYDNRTFIVEITVKDGAVGKNSVQVKPFVDGKELAPVTDGRITFKNTYTKSSSGRDDDSDTYYLAVLKVDAQDGHALKGAKFGLYVDDKQIATATSSSEGYALFSLDERVYNRLDKDDEIYYTELTAPEGYIKSSREYTVSVDNFVKNSVLSAKRDADTVKNSSSSTPDRLNDEDHFAYVIGYKDGNVRPYGLISRAETTTIFFRLLKDSVRDGNLLTSNTYTDVPDNYWANTAISTMTGLGIVQGRTATTFDPQAPITRAQFAAICARFDTGKSNGEQTFSDIQGHWAEKYIERAAELGWIKGFEDGTFRPDTYITRAQAMTMINRVLNRIPEENGDLLSSMNVWPDCNPGDWFYLAVQEATNSHDYKHKAGNYETWTGMNKDPNWTRYEN